MYQILTFVLLFQYLSAQDGGLPSVLPRILYGEKVKIEEHPYFAGLVNCGAAIISDRYLLTAAHCFDDPRAFVKYAYVGGESKENSEMVFYDQVTVHHKYQTISGIPINDVAVIRLTKPLKFSKKVQPIELPKKISTTSKLMFVGRGLGENNILTTQLLKMQVERLSTQACVSLVPPEYRHYMKYKGIIEKINICAKRTDDLPGMCQGDSGSPLTDGNVVVGLASYGGSSCEDGRLGFYVNVPYYANWIRQVTGIR